MLAFGLLGPMELLVIAIIALFVFVLPLIALVVVVVVLSKKKKQQLAAAQLPESEILLRNSRI